MPLGNVFDTLQVYLGSVYVNDFNLLRPHVPGARAGRGRVPRRAATTSRASKTRNVDGRDGAARLGRSTSSGAAARIASSATTCSPPPRCNGDAAPGGSRATAIAAMERLAASTLPPGMAIEWTDLAYQEKLAGNTALFIFPLCVLFVFLVHSAEYESWSLPLAIILIAPMCLPFALLGVWLRGMDNNLITQIGFVVLIGLAAKNAVLIVEFAKQQEDEGKDRFAAAVEACRLRLRPILMTSFAFILGVLPLARATGAGRGDAAGARHGRLQRHARRDVLRPLPDAGVLRLSSRRRRPARAETSSAGDAGGAPRAGARRDVRVDLRRADVGVAEERLHDAQVGAAAEQVRRERVAQRVRRDALPRAPAARARRRTSFQTACRVSGWPPGPTKTNGLGRPRRSRGRSRARYASSAARARPPERDDALLRRPSRAR